MGEEAGSLLFTGNKQKINVEHDTITHFYISYYSIKKYCYFVFSVL